MDENVFAVILQSLRLGWTLGNYAALVVVVLIKIAGAILVGTLRTIPFWFMAVYQAWHGPQDR